MEFNLRSIDLNLLPMFEAAYEERSLTRAAQRLAMTQPALSHALSRLRHAFRDELFIRHAKGVTPTPMADALYAKLRSALGSVREAVAESRGFDPATSSRRFSVAVPHPLGPLIALRLLERLEQSAPRITVAFNTRSLPVDLDRQLRDGTVDAVIDWVERREPHVRASPLFEDRIVAMARKGHPWADRALTFAHLASARFVSLRPRSDAEVALAGIREWRQLLGRTALEVSELLEVLLVVSASDMLGILPASLAGIARGHFDVRALKVKPATSSVPIRLFWHERREKDPAHAFLRRQIADVTGQVLRG
jgi:DNA-binding transcriptional LysR family regulator